MKKRNVLILILIVMGTVGIVACNDSISDTPFIPGNNEPINKAGCGAIIISESMYAAAESDEFMFSGVDIKSDSLILTVKYGGGCGPTSFELITDGLFMESDPVQLNVLLSFKDEDPCEMLVTRDLCFDLTNLVNLYKDSYQTDEGTIILKIRDFNTKTYTF